MTVKWTLENEKTSKNNKADYLAPEITKAATSHQWDKEFDTKKAGFRARFLLVEGIFYEASMAFFDVNSVIPLFLSSLKAPLWLIGAVSGIKLIGFYFPQTFVAGNPAHKSKAFLIRIMLLQWLSSAGMLVLTLIRSALSPEVLYFLFFALWTTFAFLDGSAFIPWSNLVGSLSEEGGCTRFLGFYQLSGGLGRVAVGIVLKLLLGPSVNSKAAMERLSSLGSGYKFSLIFALGSFSYFMTIPVVSTIIPRSRNMSASWAFKSDCGFLRGAFLALKDVTKDSEFRKFLLAWMLSFAVCLSSPFVLVYASSRMGLSQSDCGTAVSIEMLGTMAGSFLVSFLSTKEDATSLLKMTGIASLAVPSLTLLSGLAVSPEGTTFLTNAAMFSVGVFTASSWVSSTAFIMERVEEPQRSMVLAAVNTLSLPLSLFGTLGGLLANGLDYPLVFSISTVLGACATLFAFKTGGDRRTNRS